MLNATLTRSTLCARIREQQQHWETDRQKVGERGRMERQAQRHICTYVPKWALWLNASLFECVCFDRDCIAVMYVCSFFFAVIFYSFSFHFILFNWINRRYSNNDVNNVYAFKMGKHRWRMNDCERTRARHRVHTFIRKMCLMMKELHKTKSRKWAATTATTTTTTTTNTVDKSRSEWIGTERDVK